MKKVCIICRKPLNNGIMINGRGICNKCEEKIINANINSDFYNYYKKCLKKITVEYTREREGSLCKNYL